MRSEMLKAARRMTATALAAAAILAPSVAGAEGPARDPVAAEALFRAGRDLIAKGQYAEGCPKFEASFALDPSAGTLLNIAKCEEHDGKLATAWEAYARALVLNRDTTSAERRKVLEGIAKDGIAALEPRLPKLRVTVANPPAGLTVVRDGTAPLNAVLGEALPLDPGPHRVVASAPGFRSEDRSVTVEEGKVTTLDLTLVPDVQLHEVRAPVPPWAWATGAGGLALVGVGAFFLADDLAAIRALRGNCQENAKGTYCAPGYDFAHDNARKNRDLPAAIALGGAGMVAIGAAIFGIVRRPTMMVGSVRITPSVGTRSGSATVSGSF